MDKATAQNSGGARIAQTDTPAFKKWFGESKVVRKETGLPRVMYHGTDASFNEFRHGDIGFHFGSISAAQSRLDFQRRDKNILDEGLNVMPVYLSIKNPLRMPDAGDWDNPNIVANYLADMMVNGEMDDAQWELAIDGIKDIDHLKVMRQAFEAMGYDGIVYDNVAEGGGDSYIAFSPHQIKSAIGNSGDFNVAEPDIRFSFPDDEPAEPTEAPHG